MKIREIKGIGEKTEKLFQTIGINDSAELIEYFPRNYDSFDNPVKILEIEEQGVYAVYAIVTTSPGMNTKGRLKVLSVLAKDEEGSELKITWFNMAYMANRLRRGGKYVFRGKVAFKGSLVFMEQPAVYDIIEYRKLCSSLRPIYSLTAGLTNNMITKAVYQCEQEIFAIQEYLPDWILENNNLIPRNRAILSMHFPKNAEELSLARKRIVFDEFFLFTTSIRSRKNPELELNNDFIIKESEKTNSIIEGLGYVLTDAQKKTYSEIMSDMSGKRTMNRLVQGDVGSGKTIIAFLAMINCAYSGFQSALMAPTEVLAVQHYKGLQALIEKNGLPFRVELLTGSQRVKEKRLIKEAVLEGRVDFIIGTHAVITEDVGFSRLALVITDEQHRFGVKQRESLSKKGEGAHSPIHIMVMSATPIPRSLAIILYGDLDISIINEKPANRLPIKNCVVDDSYRNKAYRFIAEEVKKGHQAYVICPMAEENDDNKNNSADNNELNNVVEFSENLRNELGESVRIEFLHGKMKPSLKSEIMESFERHEIDILVSTTVVEVGINVPNATVMMVVNAERFGLAGLHQLRGRVGRGNEQSYCIFESNTKNKLTRKRLNILKESNDGFYISEQDLKLRGPGDVFGTRQSGDLYFKLGDIYNDAEVLKLAADTAEELLKKDPLLKEDINRLLRNKVSAYTESLMNRINL